MNDCGNAEIRDQLPDLVHERLDASARASIMAHVGDCVDCRDELQLLRDARRTMDRAPRVDVAFVVNALPRAPRPGMAATAAARKRSFSSDWRIAAAVTLLVAGGGSFALLRSSANESMSRPNTSVAVVSPAVTPAEVAAEVPAEAPGATRTTTSPVRGVAAPAEDQASADMGADNRLGDLSEDQLRALLQDIQNLKAVPATEPEPVGIRVGARLSSEGV